MQVALVVVEVVFQHKLKFTHISMKKGIAGSNPLFVLALRNNKPNQLFRKIQLSFIQLISATIAPPPSFRFDFICHHYRIISDQ